MKNMKKVFCFVLSLMLVFSLNITSVFAADAEGTGSPENGDIQKTTVTFTLNPSESADDGIMPLIWDQSFPAIVDHCSADMPEFYVPDRYFAYEISATTESGGSANGGFGVVLKEYISKGNVATLSAPVDGSPYKNDWIDLGSSGGKYYFRITNNTDVIINITITYYSWK